MRNQLGRFILRSRIFTRLRFPSLGNKNGSRNQIRSFEGLWPILREPASQWRMQAIRGPRRIVQRKRIFAGYLLPVAARPPLPQPPRKRNTVPSGAPPLEVLSEPWTVVAQSPENGIHEFVGAAPCTVFGQFDGIMNESMVGYSLHQPHLIQAHPQKGLHQGLDVFPLAGDEPP